VDPGRHGVFIIIGHDHLSRIIPAEFFMWMAKPERFDFDQIGGIFELFVQSENDELR
jgi:hypothetical protein